MQTSPPRASSLCGHSVRFLPPRRLERTDGRDCAHRLAGDLGDELEVAIVVTDRDAVELGSRGDEQVRGVSPDDDGAVRGSRAARTRPARVATRARRSVTRRAPRGARDAPRNLGRSATPKAARASPSSRSRSHLRRDGLRSLLTLRSASGGSSKRSCRRVPLPGTRGAELVERFGREVLETLFRESAKSLAADNVLERTMDRVCGSVRPEHLACLGDQLKLEIERCALHHNRIVWIVNSYVKHMNMANLGIPQRTRCVLRRARRGRGRGAGDCGPAPRRGLRTNGAAGLDAPPKPACGRRPRCCSRPRRARTLRSSSRGGVRAHPEGRCPWLRHR